MLDNAPAVQAVGLFFRFPREQPVLSSVNFSAHPGEFVAITGASGSGKSTLLLVLAGILRPAAGSVSIAGEVLTESSDQRAEVRRRRVGLVFQFSDLIAELSLQENVALPLELLGWKPPPARAAAGELLDQLGIAHLASRFPGQISGGQAQRAAVARALVHRPTVVLADEPTGALDTDNATRVLDLLSGLARGHGSALVVVTHEETVAARADRVVAMADLQQPGHSHPAEPTPKSRP